MIEVQSQVLRAEQILNYTFINKMLCMEAIQMADKNPIFVLFRGKKCKVFNNKPIAVLGDSALSQELCKMWYKARDESGNRLSMTMWTTIRLQVLGNAALGIMGEEVGMGAIIIKNANGTSISTPNMIATSFEALAGAVLLDGGEDALIKMIQHLRLDRHPSLRLNDTQNET